MSQLTRAPTDVLEALCQGRLTLGNQTDIVAEVLTNDVEVTSSSLAFRLHLGFRRQRRQNLLDPRRPPIDVPEQFFHGPQVHRGTFLDAISGGRTGCFHSRDHDGVIRLSSRETEVGISLSRDSPTCLVCHSLSPEPRPRWVLLQEDGSDILRSVLPIENRAECHRCHGTANELNGMLILDISLAPIQAQLQANVRRMGIVTAVMTFVLLTGVGLLGRRFILLRLTRLGRTARSIAGGALGERAQITGDDVISTLAKDFNNMADATSSLIGEIKEREQQLSGVLNSLDDGLIVLDRDLRVMAVNRSISRRLGSTPDMLRGRQCGDAVSHALPCRDDKACPTTRCLSTGQVQRAVYQLPGSPDNGGCVHEVYATPVLGEDGSVSQVVEVWRDITERAHYDWMGYVGNFVAMWPSSRFPSPDTTWAERFMPSALRWAPASWAARSRGCSLFRRYSSEGCSSARTTTCGLGWGARRGSSH